MSPKQLAQGLGELGRGSYHRGLAKPPSLPTEPHFVGSAYVPESLGSVTGDDDKVYFFFSERAVEYDCYTEQVVARVARICKVQKPAAVSAGCSAGRAGQGSPPVSPCHLPGRRGGCADPTEEVDHVPEGSAGMLGP